MDKLINILSSINDLLCNPKRESLDLSLNNVHGKGVFSLVIGGTEFGRLTRVFIAKKKLKPYDVQLHTHRYPIRLTVIKGNITHHMAHPGGEIILPLFKYFSPLNGGTGLSELESLPVDVKSYKMPIGSIVRLSIAAFHTMSCSKGSIWIVEELGFETDQSFVLGVPFITDNLYTKPEMFQVNDHLQLVKREVKRILNAFKEI
ncbi:hypothetical protein FKG96_12605 [Olivibacter sp. LS-1]|uniref:hypothetical protein n=1 Tax=Olivibacter sp. LS-1 TaxID=2592345 RepID=UPI0011EAFFD5|nr:hypothetical protein [Olivibacter sp. LS-1]QEL01613.1 hypothetical protein FKG96_12605 [Olivibacter sp. LS-1]